MPNPVNDRYELAQYIEEQAVTPTFYLNRFASTIIESEEEYVLVEMKFAGKEVAPLVMPMEQGQVIYERATSTKRLTPGYTKMKDIVTPSNSLRRRAGERVRDKVTPKDRLNAATTEQFITHDQRLTRLCELMAAHGFADGKLTLTYKDGRQALVDFGRAPALTVILDGLAGNEYWNNPAAKIVDQIDIQCKRMSDAEGGVAPTDMILPLDVWQPFKNNAQVKDSLDTDFSGQSGALERGVTMPEGIVLKGVLGNNLAVWVDTRTVSVKGVQTAMQKAKKVTFLSDAVAGAQHFGAILDVEAMIAIRMFSKYKDEFDPSLRVALSVSAPLVAPGNPNATSSMTVLE
ncbi:major capsid protein [Marinomonas shanghaiensis]|uniref:major capsid protein n=1 Tax=Marinomonas shanghaiensis TaxID=2202418 RepID=UPI000DBA38BB|nr:major capsid protein [Marinomonas shanghaiensis]